MFTIIIATYNAEKYLQDCIASILVQKYHNVELIIIDGGSSDGTLDIIKKNESVIDYWISEPDEGIYDAWNKGISIANGDWIMFLGADDKLMSNALKDYSIFLKEIEHKDIDLIASKIQMIDSANREIRVKGLPYAWPLFLKEMTIAHPGALHSKQLFQKYGLYNTSYKIVGDYELLLRAGPNLSTAYMDKITVIMREGGASDSTAAIIEHFKAITTTGNCSKFKAYFNALIVLIKFCIKKSARLIGINIYLKKV